MTRALRCLEDRLDGRLARRQVRRESAFVADAGRETALVQHRLQRVVDLGADSEGLRERGGARGDDHELLEVDRVGRVHTAVDHVHHRHGQDRGIRWFIRRGSGEKGPERLARVGRRRLRGRERDAEDRIRPEPALVGGAVELDEQAVEARLVGGVHAANALRDLAVHVRHSPAHALAAPGGLAVAELDRLVDARRCSRGNRRPPGGARLELDVDLDGRVAARVEDEPAADTGDAAQLTPSLACW